MREYENVIVKSRLPETGQHCNFKANTSFLKAVLLSAMAFLLAGTKPDSAFARNKKIIFPAGPENIYTLPDFGNYSQEVRYEAPDKILPYAYLVSAKAAKFNDQYEHVSYDFDNCVKMCEQHGFKGIYSVEQLNPEQPDMNYEKIGDWLIEHVKRNI